MESPDGVHYGKKFGQKSAKYESETGYGTLLNHSMTQPESSLSKVP